MILDSGTLFPKSMQWSIIDGLTNQTMAPLLEIEKSRHRNWFNPFDSFIGEGVIPRSLDYLDE